MERSILSGATATGSTRSPVAPAISDVELRLQSAFRELREVALSEPASLKFSRMSARRLANPAQDDGWRNDYSRGTITGFPTDNNVWQRYAAGTRLKDAWVRTVWGLPAKGTLEDFQHLAAAEAGEAGSGGSSGVNPKILLMPLGEVLARSGHSSSAATALFKAGLREALLEEVRAGITTTGKSVWPLRPAPPQANETIASFLRDVPLGQYSLNQAKHTVDSLERVAQLLRTLLDVAKEQAADVISLVQQYLDWIGMLRDRLLDTSRADTASASVAALMEQIDDAELEQTLIGIPVGFGSIVDTGEGPVGLPLAPAFRHSSLDRSFREMLTKLVDAPGASADEQILRLSAEELPTG